MEQIVSSKTTMILLGMVMNFKKPTNYNDHHGIKHRYVLFFSSLSLHIYMIKSVEHGGGADGMDRWINLQFGTFVWFLFNIIKLVRLITFCLRGVLQRIFCTSCSTIYVSNRHDVDALDHKEKISTHLRGGIYH